MFTRLGHRTVGGTHYQDRTVHINRTEALDASRQIIREGGVVLPHQDRLVSEFAHHCASDAKQLHEDEDTGSQSYRCGGRALRGGKMGHGGRQKGTFLFPPADFGNDFVPSGRKRAQKRSLGDPKRPEKGHPDREFPGNVPSG